MLLSYEYQTWVSLTNYSQGLGKLWILLPGWPTLTINMLSRYVITVRIQDLAKLDKLFTKVRVNLHFVVDLNSRGRICMSYSIIRKIQDGSLLEVMIVVTPAAVAISAAMSFVSIPPVPNYLTFLLWGQGVGKFSRVLRSAPFEFPRVGALPRKSHDTPRTATSSSHASAAHSLRPQPASTTPHGFLQ